MTRSLQGLFALMISVLTSCSWKSSHVQPIILIAVESLSSDQVSCNDDFRAPVRTSGLSTFCEESVRFSRAYTPSTQTQSALSSVFTGLYPLEHQVRHNGPQFLSGEATTLAEAALKAKYRTCFFSGGAPIWRKSGLNQGFEIFEDNISLSAQRLYRNSIENFDLFLNWLDREADDQQVFCVLYVPDLQFYDPTLPTSSSSQESFFDLQMKELDESLAYLHRELTKRKLWDPSTIILFGVSGNPTRSRNRPFDPVPLNSTNTKVALMIKPSRKKRDLGLGWRVDRLVTLADLGVTLFEQLNAPIPTSKYKDLPRHSLKGLIQNNAVSFNEDRWVLVESGWSIWRQVSQEPFYALRKGQFLIFPQNAWKIYNSLLDPLELAALHSGDPLSAKLREESRQLLSRLQISEVTSPLQSYRIEDFLTNRKIVMADLGLQPLPENIFSSKELKRLFYRHIDDRYLAERLAFNALLRNAWSDLRNLGEAMNHPGWKYVAAKNLRSSTSGALKGCLSYFPVDFSKKKNVSPSPQVCDDENFLTLLRWIVEKDESKKQRLFETLVRQARLTEIDRQAGRLNYLNYLNWDVPLHLPQGPSFSELFLALPHNKKFQETIQRAMVQKVQ